MSTDQNVLRIMSELQALATLYGEQFNAMKEVVQQLIATDEARTKAFTDQMAALTVQREAQEVLQTSFAQAVSALQEITVALINISDQLQKQLEGPSGQGLAQQ